MCLVFRFDATPDHGQLEYQTKYEENMTEISFKGVLRSTIVMFLSVGLVGI